MLKRIIFVFAVFLLFSNLYAAEFEKHTFGFGVEGGISRSFMNSVASNGEPQFDLYGTVGGNLFYQYRFNKVFALRPGIALYSYFFGVPGPMDDMEGELYATLNARIDFTFAVYAYTGRKVAFPILLTPLFVSFRIYDSAGTYEKSLPTGTEEKEVMSDFGALVGGQIAFGIERSNPRKTGVGFYIFMRMNDAVKTSGQKGVPCSMGGNFTLFW